MARSGRRRLERLFRRLFILCCLIAFAPLGTCAHSQITAVDGRGVTLILMSLPQRIVSLAPSNTEILFALGLKGRIIADTSQCNYPPEAAKLPKSRDYRISVEPVVTF